MTDLCCSQILSIMKTLEMTSEREKAISCHSGGLSMTRAKRLESQPYAGVLSIMTCLLWVTDHVRAIMIRSFSTIILLDYFQMIFLDKDLASSVSIH